MIRGQAALAHSCMMASDGLIEVRDLGCIGFVVYKGSGFRFSVYVQASGANRVKGWSRTTVIEVKVDVNEL